MVLFRCIIFISSLFFATISLAATPLPRNLNEVERVRALQILGFGSAPKTLDNPYPLGGYTGVEIGLSSEFISMEDLSALGSTTSSKSDLNFYNLSFGKGLYRNVDTFVYFTPYMQNERVQTYGGQLRWGFYEAGFFPLSVTANFFVGGANFSNLVNITTLGLDLLATVAMDNVAIYFGGGRVRAIGKFIGGPEGITNTQETETHDIIESHTVFGLNVDVSSLFFAFEIDRYIDSNYSGKLGYRF